MNALDVERAVSREAAAARDLLVQLRAIGEGDDRALVADTIEGETGLTEAISSALAEIDECDVLADGLAAKITQLETRKALIEKRRERIRAAIEQAMVSVDLPTLRLPAATLTVARRAPQLVIVNEADIPARFFTVPEAPAPKVDKKALAAALRDDEQVPGAALDNGTVSLVVRRH